MTNDEKAKAYEMALEAARKELGVDRKEWEVVEHVLHNIFPELRESEDERIRQWIREHINHDGTNMFDKAVAWLEKQKEQKPAGWSEEDEEIRQSIIKDIEWERNNTPVTVDKDIRKYNEQIAWLKSLRPQPHWKPTEEHLSALLAIFNDPNNIGSQTCQLALTDLYEQLKKL